MRETTIGWTDRTFNAWIGCTRDAFADGIPGCLECFVECDFDHLVKGKGQTRYRTSNWLEPLRWDRISGSKFFVEVLRNGVLIARGDVLKLREHGIILDGDTVNSVRPRVFCGSLMDWLDDGVPVAWRVDLLNLIHRTPNLDWQLLTRSPEVWATRIEESLKLIEARPDFEVTANDHWAVTLRNWLADWLVLHKAPENVWFGTSVENQECANMRIPASLNVTARVRFLNCEPLLGLVGLRSEPLMKVWPGPINESIHWVVCGGESGPLAREMHPGWARSLRDQCRTANVPFLFKQWGEWAPVDPLKRGVGDGVPCRTCGSSENGENVFRIGKKEGGRLLDGRMHDEYPSMLSV